MQRILLATVFGVLCIGLITWSSTSAQAPQQPSAQSKWEYRELFNDGAPNHAQLNQFGEEGWELVTVTQFTDRQTAAYFKRPKH